ncbi:response regulator transcription factor [Pseudanabaena mucicola]|uniref:Response regulator transcription factor n=1 Tax=Pseudanabaena mucicola FACHB-723 TaxID=2692860 RepID=A0ABR7ZY75_9CYAN|nr:response regulator transcription factor [Pseudanabaena mucicola]MBD2188903.1 response regulator transcription factor [Pseudanabaena mucicola FACHB-723]
MRILVVEDDVQLADMLTEALTNQQFIVDVANDGDMAWHCLETLEYDLIILDVTLPKIDGLRLCNQLRESNLLDNANNPVLMLTARDTSADKILGLDAGADVYMVKPFDMGELMAQVRALIRRGGKSNISMLSWGGLSLNSSTYEVTYDGEPLSLTPKEYQLLELLVSSGRRVLSRPGIIERLWSLDDPPSEEAVKSHIRSLRQKFRVIGAPDDLIETVHGLGYRLKQF